jgi:hypothetical protein
MTRRPCRNQSPAFKAKVALAAIKVEKTLAKLTLHPLPVGKCLRTLPCGFARPQTNEASLLVRPQSRRYHARSQIVRPERVRRRWEAMSVDRSLTPQALQQCRYGRISDRLGYHADQWHQWSFKAFNAPPDVRTHRDVPFASSTAVAPRSRIRRFAATRLRRVSMSHASRGTSLVPLIMPAIMCGQTHGRKVPARQVHSRRMWARMWEQNRKIEKTQ